MLLLSLVGWWWLFSFWFPASDDFTHAGFGGADHGRIGFSDFVASVQWDLTERNGRLADALVRVLLRPGTWLFPLLAPFLATGVGMLCAVVASPGGWAGRRSTPCWLWASGLLVLPTVSVLNPGGFGQGIYWLSGATNYLLPTGLLLASMALCRHFIAAGTMRAALVPAAVLLVLATTLLHEMSGLGLMALAAMTVLLGGSRLRWPAWTVLGAAVLGFVVHLSMPGMWGRAGRVSGAAEAGLFERLLNSAALAGSSVWNSTEALWYLLLGVLLVLALGWRSETVRARRVALAAGSVVIFAVANMFYLTQTSARVSRNSGVIPGMWLPTLAVVCGAALMVGLVGWCLWREREALGGGPVLLWVALVGDLGFVLAAGFRVPRVSLPTAILLSVLLLALVLHVGREATVRAQFGGIPARAWRGTGLAMVAVGCAVAGLWFVTTLHHVRANHEFAATQVWPELERAAHLEDGVVSFPRTLPYPDALHNRAFEVPHYVHQIRRWWGIPASVDLVNPDGDPNETWDLDYPADY